MFTKFCFSQEKFALLNVLSLVELILIVKALAGILIPLGVVGAVYFNSVSLYAMRTVYCTRNYADHYTSYDILTRRTMKMLMSKFERSDQWSIDHSGKLC